MAEKTNVEKALAEALAEIAKLKAEKAEAVAAHVTISRKLDGKVLFKGVPGSNIKFGITMNGSVYEWFRDNFVSGFIQQKVEKLGKLSMSVKEAEDMLKEAKEKDPVAYADYLAKKAKYAQS